jgi:hypothetical protein
MSMPRKETDSIQCDRLVTILWIPGPALDRESAPVVIWKALTVAGCREVVQ